MHGSSVLTQSYIDEIHGDAKTKGWWEKPSPVSDLLMLVISELSEAVEEVRNHKPPIYWNHPGDGHILDTPTHDGKVLKPEGTAVELADAWIRCADILGYRGAARDSFELVEKWWNFSKETPLGNFLELSRGVISASEADLNQRLFSEMVAIEELSKLYEYDLKAAIDYKIEYNKTRSYKHGGKLC